MDLYFWGALVRMGQVLLACFPTLIVGWLVAAIFERVLGREGTYRLFGGNTWRQLPQAWLLGMLLPVCSLGVIPVMNQMRRSGISGGTTLAFGLTAPLFNPISVLYGLTLSDPITILCFSLGSLAIVTLMGLLWDYWLAEDSPCVDPIVVAPHGIQPHCSRLAFDVPDRLESNDLDSRNRLPRGGSSRCDASRWSPSTSRQP
ncbi:MAG: permease [Pirellulales bacterium]